MNQNKTVPQRNSKFKRGKSDSKQMIQRTKVSTPPVHKLPFNADSSFSLSPNVKPWRRPFPPEFKTQPRVTGRWAAPQHPGRPARAPVQARLSRGLPPWTPSPSIQFFPFFLLPCTLACASKEFFTALHRTLPRAMSLPRDSGVHPRCNFGTAMSELLS
jgi:hypothetical protein